MNVDKTSRIYFIVVIGFLIFFLLTSGCSTVSTLTNSLTSLQMPKMNTAISVQQNPTVLNDPHAPTAQPTPTIDVNATVVPTTRPKFVYV